MMKAVLSVILIYTQISNKKILKKLWKKSRKSCYKITQGLPLGSPFLFVFIKLIHKIEMTLDLRLPLQIKGHFCSLLISNIFFIPLFPCLSFAFGLYSQTFSFSSHYNTLRFSKLPTYAKDEFLWLFTQKLQPQPNPKFNLNLKNLYQAYTVIFNLIWYFSCLTVFYTAVFISDSTFF